MRLIQPVTSWAVLAAPRWPQILGLICQIRKAEKTVFAYRTRKESAVFPNKVGTLLLSKKNHIRKFRSTGTLTNLQGEVL